MSDSLIRVSAQLPCRSSRSLRSDVVAGNEAPKCEGAVLQMQHLQSCTSRQPTWTTHHQTPQRSTTQHSTSWRSPTDAMLPGHREHTGGSRQDTHGTPVLTTVRRPWVPQPHEHAHATQDTDTSCEQGWRPNSLVAE